MQALFLRMRTASKLIMLWIVSLSTCHHTRGILKAYRQITWHWRQNPFQGKKYYCNRFVAASTTLSKIGEFLDNGYIQESRTWTLIGSSSIKTNFQILQEQLVNRNDFNHHDYLLLSQYMASDHQLHASSTISNCILSTIWSDTMRSHGGPTLHPWKQNWWLRTESR